MIKANYADKRIVMDILCDSFDTNNSVNYVIRQDDKRKERIRYVMDYSFELCSLFGDIFLTEDKKACALVLYPEKKRITLNTILLDIKLAFKSIGITRALKILERDKKIKSFYPNGPVYYLWFIGVASGNQRKGIGKALLNELIKESDSMQRSIYLEVSMPENISFYQKAGFEIYNELDFGHTLYFFRRIFIK